MTRYIRLSLCLISISALMLSSLPAMPLGIPRLSLAPKPYFKEQALAAPALTDVHDPARRGSTPFANTVAHVRALALNKTAKAASPLLVLAGFLYATAAHAAQVAAQTISVGGPELINVVTHHVIHVPYVIKSGDSLSAIAKHFGLTDWKPLYDLNKELIGTNPHVIAQNLKLLIPQTQQIRQFIMLQTPSLPMPRLDTVSLLDWTPHLPAELGIVFVVLVIALASLTWIYRSRIFKKLPMVLVFAAVLSGGHPIKKPTSARPAIAAPVVQSQMTPAIVQTPGSEMFTNHFYITPEFPHYALLTTEEKATVKMKKISAGKNFQANEPLVEITQDPSLARKKISAARIKLQEFERRDPRMQILFQSESITEQEYDDHKKGLMEAREELIRAQDSIRYLISLPFPGQIRRVVTGDVSKNIPYLDVADHRLAALPLPKNAKAFLHPGGPGVDVLALMQRGFPVTLSVNGQMLPASNFTIEGDTDGEKRVTFFIPHTLWRGEQGQILRLSIEAPALLNDERAFPVEWSEPPYEITAPEDGNLKYLHFLQPGTRLPAGPTTFLAYTPSAIDNDLRVRTARRDFLKAKAGRVKHLVDIGAEMLLSYEKLKTDLELAELEVVDAKEKKEKMQKPVFHIPSSVVIRQPLYGQGQPIKAGDSLVTLVSDRLKSVLLVATPVVDHVKPGDTLSVILRGTGARFPAVVRTIHSAANPKDREVTVEIDGRGLLRPGLCVEYDAPATQSRKETSSAHWIVGKIRQSSDYDWVRHALDEVATHPTLSEEERATIFNAIVQDATVPVLYKEWALIKLVDIGKIDTVFHFYYQQNQTNDGLRSLASRLLYDQLYEVSLYNWPALATQEDQILIDRYLVSLIQHDAKNRVMALLQLRWAQSPHPVVARWLEDSDLRRLAVDENFRHLAAHSIQERQEPLIGNDHPIAKLALLLGFSNPQRRQDLSAIGDYLTYGDQVLPLLSEKAPAFVAVVRVPLTPLKNKKTRVAPAPLESSSNNALYFAEGEPSDMSTPGAKTLAYELAETHDVVFSQLTQEFMRKKNLIDLIHLFNRLSLERRKILLSEMASSGLLANVALYQETIAWKTSLDTVWAEFFRNFYRDTLTLATDPTIRHSVIRALIKTYRTELDLAQAAYGRKDRADMKTSSSDEVRDYHQMAESALRHQITHDLLMERATLVKQKVFSDKQGRASDQAIAIDTANHALELEFSGSRTEDQSRLQALLSKTELSLQDVEQRMTHDKSVFGGSSTKLWVTSPFFNGRMRNFIVAITLLVGSILGLVYWKPKTAPTAATDSTSKPAGNVLALFAQTGNSAAREIHRDYQANKRAFFILISVRVLISVLLCGAISSLELYGNISEFLVLYLGLFAIDNIFTAALIENREVFNKILIDHFLARFKILVEHIRGRREPNPNASRVYNDPILTATQFANGQMLLLYSAADLAGMYALGMGLLFVSPGLALGYLGVTTPLVLFIVWRLGLMNKSRISPKPLLMNTLGEEKQRSFNQWMQGAMLLAKMGFLDDVAPPEFVAFSGTSTRLIKQKMKHTRRLRALGLFFLIGGAMAGWPLSTLTMYMGLATFFFLVDLAKGISEWRPANESILSFLRTHASLPKATLLPAGASIHGLELKNFSMSVVDPTNASGIQPLIQSANLKFLIGTVHEISGANGSGKTTLLRTMAGMAPNTQTSGEAQLIGETAEGEPFTMDVRAARNYVHYFKPIAFTEGMTIEWFMSKLKSHAQKELFTDLVTATAPRLLGHRQKDVTIASQGQQDRLQLAFLLARTEKPVILLDEALASMDPDARMQWISLLKKYATQNNKLILIVEASAADLRATLELRAGYFYVRRAA